MTRDDMGVDAEPEQSQTVVEIALPDGLVPLGFAELTPDVVHQDVQRTLLLLDPVDQGPDLLGVQMIHRYGDPVTTGLVDQGRGLLDRLRPVHLRPASLRAAPGHVHGRAGGTELDRDPAPGRPGRPGHQRHLSRQRLHPPILSIRCMVMYHTTYD
jgi:hypothetical protein